jgi:hypothetical protein
MSAVNAFTFRSTTSIFTQLSLSCHLKSGDIGILASMSTKKQNKESILFSYLCLPFIIVSKFINIHILRAANNIFFFFFFFFFFFSLPNRSLLVKWVSELLKGKYFALKGLPITYTVGS